MRKTHMTLSAMDLFFQVLSYDGIHIPDSLAVTAAGIAL
jgi:hypothetical protein